MSEYDFNGRDPVDVRQDRNKAMGVILIIGIILLAIAAWIVVWAPSEDPLLKEVPAPPPVEQEVEPSPDPVEQEEVPAPPVEEEQHDAAKKEVSLLVVPYETE